MRIFGFEIIRQKSIPATISTQAVPHSWLDWWRPIHEPYSGAWQQNVVTVDPQTSILAFSAVFSCVTGIASDVGKMRIKLTKNHSGIWEEITGESPYLPVLRKPNHYQIRSDFLQQWIIAKLLFGNAYILKERDERGNVRALYVLDSNRVTPLVAEDGSVYYQVRTDYLSQVSEDLPAVPASEIIHDRMVCLWHPLVGVSPIYACGVSATMGNKIQANSTNLFSNLSRPGGVLLAPGAISNETAARLKDAWETNYSGLNVGKTAVLGDGLKFEAIVMPAEAAQLIEQLRWTVEDVARAFHYPGWKLGAAMPPYSPGPEAMMTFYYIDCLQSLIEAVESNLDEGLSLPSGMGTEMDLDNLMRMDTAAQFDANNKAVLGGWMKPNEARFRANLAPVVGGDTPYLQQQMWSLAALDGRGNAPSAVLPSTAKEGQYRTPALKDIVLSDEELEVLKKCRRLGVLPIADRLFPPGTSPGDPDAQSE